MTVFYDKVNVKFPRLKRRSTSAWIKNIAEIYGKKLGDITYIFCNDEEILRINRLYLNHDCYTDIITFDYSVDGIISGDLFISLDTVKTNANLYQTDFDQELYRVMIHGILHLCGFKDKSPEEALEMRKRENQALLTYQQLNPSEKGV